MKSFRAIIPVLFLATSLLFSSLLFGQHNTDTTVNAEIRAALQTWNLAASGKNTETIMNLYDASAQIIMAGSDSAEIFKGKAEIEHWISLLFKHNSFSWIMNRIDIDHNGKTAWVFVDGFMVVKNDTGWENKTPYRFTGILVKKKDGWKWRLFDGSVPRGH